MSYNDEEYETLQGLDEDRLDDERGKEELYREDYFPPQRGW